MPAFSLFLFTSRACTLIRAQSACDGVSSLYFEAADGAPVRAWRQGQRQCLGIPSLPTPPSSCQRPVGVVTQPFPPPAVVGARYKVCSQSVSFCPADRLFFGRAPTGLQRQCRAGSSEKRRIGETSATNLQQTSGCTLD